MKKILLFAAFLLAAALTLLMRLHAADDTDAMLRRWRMAEEDKVEFRVDKMAKALTLTDAQKIDLKAAYEERINKLSDLRLKFIQGNQAVEAGTDYKITNSLTPEQQKHYVGVRDQMLREEREQEADSRKNDALRGNSRGRGVGEGMEGGMGGHGMEGGHMGGGY